MGMFFTDPAGEVSTSTVTQNVLTITATSSTVLAANPNRKFFRLLNQQTGVTSVFIHFDATAATTSNGFELKDGQEYEEGIGAGGMIYTGEIRAITASSTKSLYVEERS